MTQSIGALVAELSANTASFQKDMGKAVAILNSRAGEMNRTVAGIEKGIGRIGTAFAAVVSVEALRRFAMGVLDMGDEFAKLAQKTGVSVEKLSEFAYGAKLSDVSMQQLGDGLRKLSVAMNEAATKGTGQMAETFRALDISVTDANGKLRNTGEVFEELSARFAAAEDGPEKAAIAVQLLGRSGTELIPLMNGLKQTSAEARRLGLVMSTEAAKNAEAFNDEMSRLTTQLQYQALPAITAISKAIRAMLGSEDLDILQAKRAKLVSDYVEAINGRWNVITGFGDKTGYVKKLIAQIEELDQKIIDTNKRMLGDSPTAPAARLPTIADTGQVEKFNSLLQELQKATQQAQMAITTDEAMAAQQRMHIATGEMEFKIRQQGLWVDSVENATAEQIKISKAFDAYVVAAQKEMEFRSRTPFQKLVDEWSDTTQQMQNATAQWADMTADALTDLVMTGKADFKEFAEAVIRDLVRIMIQKQLAGVVNSISGTGTGLFGGFFADGGRPPVGVPSVVGERGPELFVPDVAGRIIPNNQLSGVSVTNVFQVSTGVADTVRAEMMLIAPVIEERSKQGVLAAIERGGRYSQAVGRKQ